MNNALLFTYNSVVDGRIDEVVENGDVDASDDETFSGLTRFVQWLSHASGIIVESPTMYLGEENKQRKIRG